ncbi:MAG: pilus assembly protein [Candidatus Electronema sp. V4]|uniref:pilus assembly protein n=1 Tax=Candidatus Electronema sp. V4 TaxID=3454756 RepID=UPI0040558703
MKRTALFFLTGVSLLAGASFAAETADVCGQGQGIPPFLTSGAKPNLLMVLDNSGSMLDGAYSKEGAFCFDDTYSREKVYAGYFQNDMWYTWTEGYPPWQNNTSYTSGKRVYMNGIVWEVDGNGGTSSASPTTFAEDTGVTWRKIFSIPKWQNGATYAVNDFVWSGPQIYKAKNAGVSQDTDLTDGVDFADATGVAWEAVDSTWLPGKSYAANSIVSYRGMLYVTASSGTSSSSATGLYDDTLTWKRVNEGSFAAAADQSAACSSAAGGYTHDDLCIKINAAVTPNRVTSFAAKGNLLNWAMSSKFDIEKKILTGGKHNYFHKNNKEGFLVSENRGCAGSRTIKQIPVLDAATSTTKYLSLGVRGSRHKDAPAYEDRIDTTDDTGRLEVLAVTENGYEIDPLCQAAIDKIAKNDGDLNGTQGAIDKCIGSFPPSDNKLGDMRPALNHSLQACWQDNPATPELEINKGKFKSLVDACWALYTGDGNGQLSTDGRQYEPYELRPADGGPYICYGVYDSGVAHPDRVGYMGRVWNSLGGGGTYDCQPLEPTDTGAYVCTGNPCYWKRDNQDNPSSVGIAAKPCYKNENGYVYQCGTCTQSGNNSDYYGNNQSLEGQCKTGWLPRYITVPGGDLYTNDNTCGGKDGDLITLLPDWQDPAWAEAAGNDNDPMTGAGNGIVLAIKDYCDSLRVPEVIDPSDAAGKTSTTGGMPGMLRDSELMAFLGGQDPLLTMKGVIQQTKRPVGVLHNVAQDLRLGAMSFRYVGAKTECDQPSTNSKLEKYCPLNNRDGAELLAPLEWGADVQDEADPTYPDNNSKRLHVHELAEAVNGIRATSWTPLAEAVYEALGYYTQNSKFCLNCTSRDASGFCLDTPGNCLDFPTDNDPVLYSCQDNHILVISEGESTADINAKVKSFTEYADPENPNNAPYFLSKERAVECQGSPGPDDLKGDNDGIGVAQETCGDDLYSSPYLDNVTWWGQNALPLYKNRCVKDVEGNQNEKQKISTFLVTTGSLVNSGTGECNPVTLMTNAAANGGTELLQGENPQDLEDNLYAVLDDILSRASAGSAASVISSSRSGSGAVYQAVFWPRTEDAGKNKVTWVGDVHALFISSDGLMYEDTDQNGKLEPIEKGGTDRRVIFYFSPNVNRTRACYDIPGYMKGPDGTAGTADDFQCLGDTDPAKGAHQNDWATGCTKSGSAPCAEIQCIPNVDCGTIQVVNYLWSANDRLAALTDTEIGERKIFTWNDFNNDGIVDEGNGEFFQLQPGIINWADLNGKVSGDRGPVTKDFLSEEDRKNFVTKQIGDDKLYTQDSMDALVSWLQGRDPLLPVDAHGNATNEVTDANFNGRLDKRLRSRAFNGKTWRLGDVIHSTPMVVAKPAEAYHYIYRDPTYNEFVKKWINRRNMIYFGANDGMLHAVNGGFYFHNHFCCTDKLKSNGDCEDPPANGVCSSGADLGEEMWAYVPYNLQPHLKCLADRFYAHKYYVDHRPRIFDVQIFKEEAACGGGTTVTAPGCIHPGGWGTIIVGSMRFGGAPIFASELNGMDGSDGGPKDTRMFTSSFFILDVTNPEQDPVLLGEMTQLLDPVSGNKIYADMGYTTSSPAMVIMRDGGAGAAYTKWYLVMGNGPKDLDGSNNQRGKLAVLPLERLAGDLAWSGGRPNNVSTTSKNAFRILDHETKATATATDLKGCGAECGIFSVPVDTTLPETQKSFISDIISVDYNIDLSAVNESPQLGARYRTDAVYFGTVDGGGFVDYPLGYLSNANYPLGLPDQHYWDGGGRVFRLVTKMLKFDEKDLDNDSVLDDEEDVNHNGVLDKIAEEMSAPSDWKTLWTNNDPLRLLAKVKMPVIAAPSIGYDNRNYWIYAGTGRFFHENDKTDDGRCYTAKDATCTTADSRSKVSMFGFKEPLKDAVTGLTGWDSLKTPPIGLAIDCADSLMTWGEIKWDINNLANDKLPPFFNSTSRPAGERGLMQTDKILVGSETGYLYCYNCNSNYSCTLESNKECFPGVGQPTPDDKGPVWDIDQEKFTFDKLQNYIAGTGCDSSGTATGIDGWYRDFHGSRERNLGTSALLGGLLTYTTYQPFNDKCKAEGESFLHGIHFQTGTAWVKTVFGTVANPNGSGEIVMDKLSLGRGLSETPSITGSGDPDSGGDPSDGGEDGGHDAKAFIQTSTGEIIEVTQKNLPINNTRSGRLNWTDRCSDE